MLVARSKEGMELNAQEVTALIVRVVDRAATPLTTVMVEGNN